MSNLVGKVVTYNGGTDAIFACSCPNNLVCGKRYLVTSETIMDFQTNVHLRGVVGEFNSVWFDEVKVEKKKWLAIATLYNKPEFFIGKRISLKRLCEDMEALETVNTSTILSIRKIYEDVYLIETENSVYVTKVKLRAER